VNWGALYALVATACGYTWPEIDAMTLPAIGDLVAYWKLHPPAHLLLAAAYGFKPKPAAPRADFAELAALAPGGVFSARGEGAKN